MGDPIPFPERLQPAIDGETSQTFVSVSVHGAVTLTDCSDPIHVFEAKGMACQCGQEFWSKDDIAPGTK